MPKPRPGSTNTPSPSQPIITKNQNRILTISSIEGDYLYVVVQITQDMQAVAYPDWKLPGDKFNLYVSTVTLSQFDKLAVELGRKVDMRKQNPTTPAQWYSVLRRSMLSLVELLSVSDLTIRCGSHC
jgi:CDK inhibitor PHO81